MGKQRLAFFGLLLIAGTLYGFMLSVAHALSGAGGCVQKEGQLVCVRSQGQDLVGYITDAKITYYPREIRIFPGGSDTFELWVKGTGNRSIENLRIEAGSPWLSFGEANFSLNPGELRRIGAKIAVPPEAGQEKYHVSIYLVGDSTDSVSFIISVTNITGESGISIIDTEYVRAEHEKMLEEIQYLSAKGYDTGRAEQLLFNSVDLFRNGDILGSADILPVAWDALKKSNKKFFNAKVFLGAYFFVGLITALVLLIYYFYAKHKEKADRDALNEWRNEMRNQRSY